jgi:GDPmannose 4,6-dehydratase
VSDVTTTKRRALITGIGGQDGSLLAELLVAEGYDVYGVIRRDGAAYPNLAAIRDSVELIQADLTDQAALTEALRECRPHEVYNLASVSFVPMSWEYPVLTAELAAVGATSLLEAIRATDESIRFYQASSSEIFGEPVASPQHEDTPLNPLTPYGVAKAYAHFIARSYRKRYGLHASCGILFNHTSPRQSVEFLPRKVAAAAASISLGNSSEVRLGELLLQQDTPDDYVIATGETHSVEELVATAFGHVGLDWRDHVRVDESLKRGKAELHRLVGDAGRAQAQLGWERGVTFEELVRLLVDAELEVDG